MPEEMGLVLREMAFAELGVAHGEEGRREGLIIRLPLAGDVSSTPAGVDEFPLPVIDSDRIPGMPLRLTRDRGAGREGRETVSFPVPTDDKGFKPRFCGDGGEEGGIAFTDGETSGESGGGGGWFDGVIEEGDGVVGDVMVEPGKYRAGFVGGGGEGRRQLVG